MPEYTSSEELQRHNHIGAFASDGDKKAERDVTEVERVKKVLDKHIKQHSSTRTVRDEATKHQRTADYQLDLSADIVEILEKIKSELR